MNFNDILEATHPHIINGRHPIDYLQSHYNQFVRIRDEVGYFLSKVENKDDLLEYYSSRMLRNFGMCSFLNLWNFISKIFAETWDQCHKNEYGEKDLIYPINGRIEYFQSYHDINKCLAFWTNERRVEYAKHIKEACEIILANLEKPKELKFDISYHL